MALGFGELFVLLGGLVCCLSLPIAALVYALAVANKEWRVVYEGHEIVLQNRLLSEKLYIDGRVVDQSGFGFTAQLRGRLELEGGRGAIVEGRIGQGFLGLTIRGRIFVDGRYAGGDPQ